MSGIKVRVGGTEKAGDDTCKDDPRSVAVVPWRNPRKHSFILLHQLMYYKIGVPGGWWHTPNGELVESIYY